MKILYVVHQFYPEFGSGTEKFLFNIASALQRDGNAVHVATYTFEDCDTRREGDLLMREYSYRGIPVTAVREAKLPIDVNTSWGSRTVGNFAQEYLKSKKPDIVHLAHGMRLGAFAQAAGMLGIPYVLTLTDFWTICPKITLQTSSGNLCAGPNGGDECAHWCPELGQQMVRSRLRQSEHALENAKAVVAPSTFVASLVQAEFPKVKVRIIPHGIRRPRSLRSARTYGAGNKLVFGYAGGLAPHKGVHILISSFRNVTGAAELWIYGSHFEQPDYFELLKRTANDDPRIRFCATYSDDELDSIFQELDLLVVPSLWYETYSFSAHEALARGIPVIASKLGALQDPVQDGVSGFTVAPGNVADLARMIESLITNPEQLNQITANLRARVAPMLEEEAYLYQRIYDRPS